MSKTHLTPDELLAKVDALTLGQTEVLEAINKSRTPGYNQPVSVMQQMAKSQDKVGTGPWKSLGHMMQTVAKQCPNGNWQSNDQVKAWHAHAQKTLPTGLNETVGADGGVLVPPTWTNQIMMKTYLANDLLGRTTMLPITVGNTVRVPAVNETSRANGSRFGGVSSYWRSEAGQLTASKPSFDLITLTLESLTALMRLTQEVIDDAPMLEALVNMIAPMELAFRIGDALVNGDGVTKPVGLLNSPSKITVSKVPGQAAGTILAHNVNEMWSRLHVSCRDNAVWLVDQTTEPALDEMTIGTAGAQMVVYLPVGGLSTPRLATLKGKQVLPIEFCAQLGTVGDIILTDLATLLSITKGGIESAVSMHFYFDTNEQAFRWVVRLDSKSWWLSPLSPRSGGPTQSNIVVLESRS